MTVKLRPQLRDYELVAGWITLANETSLEDVGIAAALAEAGIGCNVLAGVHHDHILVPVERAAEALAALG